MMKEDFLKEAMRIKVMKVIQEYYKVPDESEALEIYEELDKEFQRVFEKNEYCLVHDEANHGYLNYSEYESYKDYWICEYILGTIKVELKINFKDLVDFEIWVNND